MPNRDPGPRKDFPVMLRMVSINTDVAYVSSSVYETIPPCSHQAVEHKISVRLLQQSFSALSLCPILFHSTDPPGRSVVLQHQRRELHPPAVTVTTAGATVLVVVAPRVDSWARYHVLPDLFAMQKVDVVVCTCAAAGMLLPPGDIGSRISQKRTFDYILVGQLVSR